MDSFCTTVVISTLWGCIAGSERADMIARGRKILSDVEECGINRFNEPGNKKFAYKSRSRIVGGRDTEDGQFPWLVRMQIKIFLCGGSLITLRHILTAAHCLAKDNKSVEMVDLRVINIIFGEHDRTKKSKKNFEESDFGGILRAKIHDAYKPDPYFLNDIAVIELKRDVKKTEFIRPICLPFGNEARKASLATTKNFATVAGWGFTIPGVKDSNNVAARKLRMVKLPVISPETCEKLYHKNMFNSKYQICAGGEKNKDSCGGDSGSPLMKVVKKNNDSKINIHSYILIGMVSYGPQECGIENRAGVYTRVEGYDDWISEFLPRKASDNKNDATKNQCILTLLMSSWMFLCQGRPKL